MLPENILNPGGGSRPEVTRPQSSPDLELMLVKVNNLEARVTELEKEILKLKEKTA